MAVTKAQRESWFRDEFVRRHLSAAFAEGRAEWEQSLLSMIESNCLYTSIESPIEMVFVGCWTILSAVRGGMDDIGIRLQHEVQAGGKTYRVDVALAELSADFLGEAAALGVRAPRVAVELDGHEFHERTREQVAHRDARDRALQADGWTVFHVSGSVINRNPLECVWGVYRDAQTVFSGFRNSLYGIRSAAETAVQADQTKQVTPIGAHPDDQA
jgi:very-short-patch-repair endonuclease